MTKPKRAAVYVRISQDREGGGLGVTRQREDCEALATSCGYDVIGVYTDNDRSAYSGKPRPDYLRLLEDIRAGRVDVVICWHTDRLHRSSRELLDYFDACEPRNVKTETVKAGKLDLSTHAGRLQAKIVGDFAEYESGIKSDRLISQKATNAKQGRFNGGRRPFGFQADGITPRPDEAALVREIATSLLAGESCSSVARSLNERGITTSTGSRWLPTTVRRVMTRPRNAGLLDHRGEVVAKLPESILTEAEHYGLLALLTDPARRLQTTNKVRNLLAGLIVCPVCGQGLRSASTTTRSGKLYRLYRCHMFPSADYAEDRVTRWILVLLCSPDAIRVLMRPKKQNRDLSTETKNLTRRLDDAAKAYSRGDLSLSMLTNITKDVEPQLERLRKLDVDDTSARKLGELPSSVDVVGTWQGLSLARKRALIDYLVTIEARKGGKLTIKPKHPEVERAVIALSKSERDGLALLVS